MAGMKRPHIALACGAALSALLVTPVARADAARGALLYDNHCIACHSTQMHWRDQRLAKDWTSLRALVRRWQGAAQLNWSDEELEDVTRHLNERFYHFEPPALRISKLTR